MALDTLPVVTSTGGHPTEARPVILVDPAGAYAGGAGGGSVDISTLAKEAKQDTANAALGTPADAEATGDGSLIAVLKRLRSQLSGLLGVVPQMSSGGHLAVTTAAGGTTFTAFASQTCKQVTVFNNTSAVLEAQQGGSGVAVPIFIGQAFTFFGLTNCNQIGLRRVDQSTTTVTAQARWEA